MNGDDGMKRKVPHFCEYCEHEIYDKERQMVRCELIKDSYKYKYDSEQRQHCPMDKNSTEVTT